MKCGGYNETNLKLKRQFVGSGLWQSRQESVCNRLFREGLSYGEQESFSGRKKSQSEGPGVPGTWSSRKEVSVSGKKWERGKCLQMWFKREQVPGHMGLISHDTGFRVDYVS